MEKAQTRNTMRPLRATALALATMLSCTAQAGTLTSTSSPALPTSSQLTLNFNTDMWSVFSVLQTTNSAIDNPSSALVSTYNEALTPELDGVSAFATALTRLDYSGAASSNSPITTAQSDGTLRIEGYLENMYIGSSSPSRGGFVELSRLTVDLTNQTVYGDLMGANQCATGGSLGPAGGTRYCGSGSSLIPPTTVNLTQIPLFSFTSITGSPDVNLGNLAAPPSFNTTFNDLRFIGANPDGVSAPTPGSAAALIESTLGLRSLGQDALRTIAITGMGSITISAVPEPSTWALFGLGLVATVSVVRRRGTPKA